MSERRRRYIVIELDKGTGDVACRSCGLFRRCPWDPTLARRAQDTDPEKTRRHPLCKAAERLGMKADPQRFELMPATVEQTPGGSPAVVCPRCGASTGWRQVEETVVQRLVAGLSGDGRRLRVDGEGEGMFDADDGHAMRLNCSTCGGDFAIPDGVDVDYVLDWCAP